LPAKPVLQTTCLGTKLYLSQKDYVKNTRNGRRWRWYISDTQAPKRYVVNRGMKG